MPWLKTRIPTVPAFVISLTLRDRTFLLRPSGYLKKPLATEKKDRSINPATIDVAENYPPHSP